MGGTTKQTEDLLYRKANKGLKLSYPLEDWIEGLLDQYPEELNSIRPKSPNRRQRQSRSVRFSG
ncbi:hypothetical protein [Pelagicoccus sp. SDUM812003]|uniref:hypothetical protein n=1 Tax=Pelagicoccus sp. SDUM812003 TaxID=3041267 RepID=UPI00280E3766|nr:hypothetical protein [Pelagicoccus sp. SDUM812003]MDQ8203007.1 hypothetical protein [Pelagicoccus sp. SDUM812003]